MGPKDENSGGCVPLSSSEGGRGNVPADDASGNAVGGIAAASRPIRHGELTTYAAIDLGTSNCRLLVARPMKDGFRVIDAFSKVTRLGENVADTGELSEAAMDRTVDALRICARKIRRARVHRIRAVATEACRQARNSEIFIRRVERETGLSLELIDACEEARLAATGCLPLVGREKRHALIFDIGGGSTQVMWLTRESDDGYRMVDTYSVPVGVVNLSERIGTGRIGAEAFAEACERVRGSFRPFCTSNCLSRRFDVNEALVVGTSGTVTTLGGLEAGLQRYDRTLVDGTWLTRDAVSRWSRFLAEKSLEEREAIGCVGPVRASFVVAGCAILQGICIQWPTQGLRVADRGVREGILSELMLQDTEDLKGVLPLVQAKRDVALDDKESDELNETASSDHVIRKEHHV